MLYLHDTRVKFIGMSMLGTFVEDTYGNRHLCYGHGKAIEACLGATRRPLPVGQLTCEGCDYEKRTYKCGGSCLWSSSIK